MKKKKKIIIIFGIIIVLIAIIGLRSFLGNKDNTLAVNTIKTTRKDLKQSISLTGTIKANNSEEIILPTNQKIISLHVKEGDQVKKGQLLAKLDTKELESQLTKSNVALELSKWELENLKKDEDNTSREAIENAIKQAELNLESITQKYEDTERHHQQNIRLHEAGFLSDEELSNSQSLLNEMQNNVENGKIVLQNAENSLKDFENNIYRQERQLEISYADQRNLLDKIASSNIKAGIDGKVINMPYKENQYPLPNDSIKIYDLSRYKIELSVDQYDAIDLRLEQRASISVRGIDKTYTGRVTKIGQVATEEMRGTNRETKVSVEVTIDEVDDIIKVGYEADVEIALEEKPESISVTYEAVQTDDKGNKFLFILEEGLAVKRIVETGLETDFDIEIISGLKEGEEYISNPPKNLKEGQEVTVSGGI